MSMKCIQTLWTRDVAQKNLLSISAGWRSCEYHWMSWALSCLQLKKMFGEVELVTDTNGSYVLSTIFQLPYSHISTLLDNKMKSYPADVWALAKIYSYQKQTEPFLHFDSDFYLWNAIGNTFFDAQVIAQNLEKNLPFYKAAFEDINKNLPFIPDICRPEHYNRKDIYACNAGVFGGNNLPFIQRYCRLAIDFADRNKGRFGYENAANANFIFEQYFLYCLAESEAVPITFLSPVVQENPLYNNYVQFGNVPFVPFIHPVGGYKKNVEICDHVAAKLRMEYPDYYYRILSILNKKDKLIYTKTFYTEKTLQQKSNRYFSEKKSIYKRTISALQYLQNAAPEMANSEWKAAEKCLLEQDVPACKKQLQKLDISKPKKKLLLELFCLESKKERLYKTVFIKDKKQQLLYRQETEQYSFLQKRFAATVNEVEALVVEKNPNLVLVAVSRNWTCKIPEQTGQMITDKFGEKENRKAQTALVPHISRRDVDEHYLEPIDVLLLGLCCDKTTLSALIRAMEIYFPAEEIQADYDSFRYLIISTIKRLMYLGILFLHD